MQPGRWVPLGVDEKAKKKDGHNCFKIDYFDGNNHKKLII